MSTTYRAHHIFMKFIYIPHMLAITHEYNVHIYASLRDILHVSTHIYTHPYVIYLWFISILRVFIYTMYHTYSCICVWHCIISCHTYAHISHIYTLIAAIITYIILCIRIFILTYFGYVRQLLHISSYMYTFVYSLRRCVYYMYFIQYCTYTHVHVFTLVIFI